MIEIPKVARRRAKTKVQIELPFSKQHDLRAQNLSFLKTLKKLQEGQESSFQTRLTPRA